MTRKDMCYNQAQRSALPNHSTAHQTQNGPLWQKNVDFSTGRGNLGGLGKAYNLSSHICNVSSSGTLVNTELTSIEHMNLLL